MQLITSQGIFPPIPEWELVPTILQHTDTAPCETDSEVTDVVRATL